MSRTKLLPLDPGDPASARSQASLVQAAAILRGGGTVAFPTETVYGLGANALDPAAVEKIFEAKQRPGWDPLIVHLAPGLEMLETVAAEVSRADRLLIEAFWPGPLTLLMRKQLAVPSVVTAGRELVGIRVPAHPVAQALLTLAAIPVAAPSANTFGRTSPTTAQHVMEDLDGRIDAVLDGGSTALGLESTVIDANAQPPLIYRHGMISIERIRIHLPTVMPFVEQPGQPRKGPESLPSPGVGLRHYAPSARLVLLREEEFTAVIDAAAVAGISTGVLLPAGFSVPDSANLHVFEWGRWSHVEELAARLFQGLRELDRLGVDQILCPLPDAQGIGSALRDRLKKAAMPVEPDPRA